LGLHIFLLHFVLTWSLVKGIEMKERTAMPPRQPGRPRDNPDELRARIFQVRITASERAAIEAGAKARQTTMTRFLLDAAIGKSLRKKNTGGEAAD
jgi:hypothetical protein